MLVTITWCILKYVRLNSGDKAENQVESDRKLMAPVCAGVVYEASGLMGLSEGDRDYASLQYRLSKHVFSCSDVRT